MSIPTPNMKRLMPGVQTIIAVASGKGGVGKTTCSVNLALALSQSGASVGIYDADLYGPNVALMLGVRRKQSKASDDPIDMIPTVRASSKPYIPPLERYGLKVMSIALLMGSNDAITPDPRAAGDIIRQTLQDVKWGALDYLVIDLPPGTGEPQQTLLRTIQIHGVVIVTTPQEMSLMDASRSIGLYEGAGVPLLGVLENMSYLNCPHCGEPIEIFPKSDEEWTVQKDALEILGRVPLDPHVGRKVDENHALLTENGASVFREIAAKVIEKVGQ